MVVFVKKTDFVGVILYEMISRELALELEYPSRRLAKTPAEVDAAFRAVVASKMQLVKTNYKVGNMADLPQKYLEYRGSPTINALSASDYYTMTWLSDYFNERARLAAKRSDEPVSPLEYWRQNRAKLVAAAPDPVGIEALSDAVYAKIRGCGNFRPNLLTGFARYFEAKSVSDPCAGWGDRLIGAIAAGVSYTGVDPNPALHPGYAEIISRFARDPGNYTTVAAAFEDYTPTREYDLVFTCPPYFTTEIYTDDALQSVVRYPNLDTWIAEFLVKMAAKSLAALSVRGHLVVVLNDAGGAKYTRKFIDTVSAMPGAEYLGAISYAERAGRGYRSPQPVWIWRKTA